jgi:wyosine [tRNA(Phe)-imidazoG37] synthetase (radical SAM superfamily)
MATFLFDKIVFGPVKSRRLGVSLGINLLPNDCKLCNFNCIYCECGWTPNNKKTGDNFHPREIVKEKLEQKLQQIQNANEKVDAITFAGNGEPTMHPDFEGIIEDTINARNAYFKEAQIVVLSNSTLIHKNSIKKALLRVDQNILKLDSVFEDTVKILNQPQGYFNLEKTIEYLTSFNGKLIVQTLFVNGLYKGQAVDNTTKNEVEAWLKVIEKINPEMVMIYTIARDTPLETLNKVSLDKLNELAKLVEKLGIKTQVSS